MFSSCFPVHFELDISLFTAIARTSQVSFLTTIIYFVKRSRLCLGYGFGYYDSPLKKIRFWNLTDHLFLLAINKNLFFRRLAPWCRFIKSKWHFRQWWMVDVYNRVGFTTTCLMPGLKITSPVLTSTSLMSCRLSVHLFRTAISSGHLICFGAFAETFFVHFKKKSIFSTMSETNDNWAKIVFQICFKLLFHNLKIYDSKQCSYWCSQIAK